MNINTEKKLIKEVNATHETERKSFETKMKEWNKIFIKLELYYQRDQVSAIQILPGEIK